MNTSAPLITWGITIAVGLAALASSAAAPASAGTGVAEFGRTPEGKAVQLFTLRNSRGLVAKVCEYGVTLTELHVPDRNGRLANVVLGFDKLEPYLGSHPSFGATIGRFANRIAGARFQLDGKEVRVTPNSGGKHHIHGGKAGFGRVIWQGRALPVASGRASAEFTYQAADGEEGYPGKLAVTVVVSLSEAGELSFEYSATTDKPTVLNLTNHSYFNLAGSGDVKDHQLQIFASRYTPSDADLIPTGEIAPVKGTGLDFSQPCAIGARISEFYPRPGGYDHNYVIDGQAGELKRAARVVEPRSGRVLECSTTEPGVQLYTANWTASRLTGVGGVAYGQHAGFCLETQHYPDSPNKPNFPSVVLRPGETFRSTTRFKFSAE